MKMYKSPSPRMRRTNGRSQEHLPGPGHPAKAPDIPRLERLPLQLLNHQVPTGPGHPAPQARTSGTSQGLGHLEDTGRPAALETPDDRPPADVRYLAASRFGPRPMYPYFHPHLHLDYK